LYKRHIYIARGPLRGYVSKTNQHEPGRVYCQMSADEAFMKVNLSISCYRGTLVHQISVAPPYCNVPAHVPEQIGYTTTAHMIEPDVFASARVRRLMSRDGACSPDEDWPGLRVLISGSYSPEDERDFEVPKNEVHIRIPGQFSVA
jgi:hypothetical protein